MSTRVMPTAVQKDLDPVAVMKACFTQVAALVRKHSKADRDLFIKTFVEYCESSDLSEQQDAMVTMVEILSDPNGKTSAHVKRWPLPAVVSEDGPRDPALRKWVDFVGKKIRSLRDKKGWTQEELAKKAGLTQSHVSRIEQSKHSPSHKTLVKIAKALGVAVGTLDPVEPFEN